MKLGALLIRADATVSTGIGHVMRCMALAQAWQDAGGVATFAVAEIPEMLQPRLISNGFSLLRINASPGSFEDAVASVAQARQLNVDWIVVDGDRFRSDFLAHLRSAGLRVLLVDDFADRIVFPANLIINPNLGVDGDLYRRQGSDVLVLAGPRFALLRREFQQPYKTRGFAGRGNRVLITLGGSDPEDLASRIASLLARCADLSVTLVVGAGYSKISEIQEFNTDNLRVVLDAQDMAGLMKTVDLAVIAAGGTLWELLSMGCPVLSYARNSVQTRVVQSLAKDGVVIDLGATSCFDPERLVAELRPLADSSSARELMSSLAQRVVDGFGARRVVEALQHSRA